MNIFCNFELSKNNCHEENQSAKIISTYWPDFIGNSHHYPTVLSLK
jgi:hypothetical protein